MAKIAIDARRLRTSTGRYCRELLSELEKIDKTNEYHVIIHQKDQGVWAPTADNFVMHVVKWDHYTFGEQLGFARFLYKLKPDLVHFTMPQQPLIYIGKRVTTIHDLTLVKFKNLDKNRLIYWIEQQIFKFLLKNVARRSKAVITPSKFVADEVSEYARIDRSKVVVTYEAATELPGGGNGKPETENRLENGKQETGNGAADEGGRENRNPEIGNRMRDAVRGEFLFYVGNAYPHKNLKRLVDAHRLLKQKHPKLKLVIAGKRDFFHKQLLEYVNEQKQTNVLHLGWVDDEQLAWLYRHAKAYVFPSLSEGFGLPGLEAMQSSAPLVSSNATCLPEVYGDAAHYFDPESVEDMAKSIEEVIRSKTRRESLIKAGHKQLEKYSWQKTAKATHKVYSRFIN